MSEQRLVKTSDGTEFYVELADVEQDGPVSIADHGPLSFEGVAATVQGIATDLSTVWKAVEPDEASVTFGLKLTGKSGELTDLVVGGSDEANL
jgi:hypothetical protein